MSLSSALVGATVVSPALSVRGKRIPKLTLKSHRDGRRILNLQEPIARVSHSRFHPKLPALSFFLQSFEITSVGIRLAIAVNFESSMYSCINCAGVIIARDRSFCFQESAANRLGLKILSPSISPLSLKQSD